MNFQSLQKVEPPEFYLDIAIRQGKRHAEKARQKATGDHIRKASIVESERISSVGKTLESLLFAIIKNFPVLEDMDMFYKELIKCTADYSQIRKSLGAINWADIQVKRMTRIYVSKIRRSKDIKSIYTHKKSYYGRISSTIKQVRSAFIFLESARKTLKKLPAVKTGIPTIVIAGYPNVGKTTLLRALTGSEPEIAPYPFTTKGLMLGYAEADGKKIQIIDTPGLLDRPLEKRNRIELQSILALKHLADRLIFVIDPTEICGYGVEEQLNLLGELKRMFSVKITVAINKIDIAEKEAVDSIKKKIRPVFEMSAEKSMGIEMLKKSIQVPYEPSGENDFFEKSF